MPEIPLSKLRSEHTSQARDALPACRADSPDTVTAGVEIPEYGLVRITFEKKRHVFHRTRRWYWLMVRAETD